MSIGVVAEGRRPYPKPGGIRGSGLEWVNVRERWSSVLHHYPNAICIYQATEELMDQDEFDAMCITKAASEAIEASRQDVDVAKLEVVRRVGRWDNGFTPSQYWRIRAGRSTWSLDRFVYVAAALGLDPPMLLDRILRGHDIMAQLRARAGPDNLKDEGADGQSGGAEGEPTS